ncbi:unnamed protein product [Owenia fusiformis]|uniref:Coiled-coil domain-containing protein 112 n=1 Tax=Owenia fusiformis TaxID=6347 RepID=A0A8S4PQ98_OWEFU|nr:unnamed protein product [Owenia fusiformis]
MAKSSRNPDIAKKVELIKEVHQLEIKVQNMEREKTTHLYNRRNDFREEFRHLEELDRKLSTDQKTEKSKLQQQLTKIRTNVRKFHRELKDVKPTPEFVEKLKVIMEDIEGTISNFKQQQRLMYEELLHEEKSNEQDILALEKKFESWSQLPAPVSARPTFKPVRSARDVTKDLPPEVAEFERFLQQTGGMRGGWDDYDHGTFMKFRNKHKGKTKFLREAISAIPTKTADEVRDHENWYQEFLMLNDRKKEAIQKWRDRKQEEKDEVFNQSDSSDDSVNDEDKKKMALQAKIERERRERAGQLNSWKVQKELERAEREEKQLREQLIEMRKKEKSQERQREMRAKVADYKQQKDEEEQIKQEIEFMEKQANEDIRRRIGNKEIARFKERDNHLVQSKLEKERQRAEEEREKQKRLQRLKGQVKVHVTRDPNRLLKPTKGWEERQKDQTKSGGQVLHVQHKAVPSWRAGLG